ncbi:TetR-like C-terminal domain-containing protein, partial [Streptomyces sp. NPDC001193]
GPRTEGRRPGLVGRAVQTALFSDAGRLPEVAEGRRRVLADRFRRAEPVVVRAVERGELPVGTDHVALFETMAAPIYFRLLVGSGQVGVETADHAVRITLAAARAGALAQGSGVHVEGPEADSGQE